MNWIRFVRQYGPIPRNDNMYDEHIQRAARRAGVRPIAFEHPLHNEVLSLFKSDRDPISVVLTGDAGDGKTHLCREVWQQLTGDTTGLTGRPYVKTTHNCLSGRTVTIHVIKDLSEWATPHGMAWEPEKRTLLETFCRSVFETNSSEVFLIAANDGQLVESWRRLGNDPYVAKARRFFETLLVENRRGIPGIQLTFFNLSLGSSALLFDRALEAFLNHEGWEECRRQSTGDNECFGKSCPIRHNYELLQRPLLQRRLRALLDLCDFNDLHIPIRQVLVLLSNALLGHPDVKDGLLQPSDIAQVIRNGTVSKASLYNNIFGGNLPENRREAHTIFSCLDKFRIGHETTNQIDNILVFGEADEKYRRHFDMLVGADSFYGADAGFRAAQLQYVEGSDPDETNQKPFLQMLLSKRRGLFFTIPEDQEEALGLWEMTVFKYAGEYLSRLMPTLRLKRPVEQPILARLVKGLNRIFVGMLTSSDRELLLATSLSFSNAKISRLLEDRVSVRARMHEQVEIVLDAGVPKLKVSLTENICRCLDLHLVRYEFLSRVAEGALPSSFSRECYEDILVS